MYGPSRISKPVTAPDIPMLDPIKPYAMMSNTKKTAIKLIKVERIQACARFDFFLTQANTRLATGR